MHDPTEPPAVPAPQDIIDKVFPILGIPTMRELVADPARLAVEVPDEDLEAYARVAATVLSDLAVTPGNPERNAEAFGRHLTWCVACVLLGPECSDRVTEDDNGDLYLKAWAGVPPMKIDEDKLIKWERMGWLCTRETAAAYLEAVPAMYRDHGDKHVQGLYAKRFESITGTAERSPDLLVMQVDKVTVGHHTAYAHGLVIDEDDPFEGDEEGVATFDVNRVAEVNSAIDECGFAFVRIRRKQLIEPGDSLFGLPDRSQ